MKDKFSVVLELALSIADAGGRAYYVGGYVRDRILGFNSEDVDIEVYGLTEQQLLEKLCDFGKVETLGAGYGILTLSDYGVDVALPRTEVCTGTGHKDFKVTTNPWLTPEVACRRRDFTVNAMLMDIITGEVVDPYGGLEDIKRKVIHHIDAGIFAEDPLRVLRACQFSARLGYTVDKRTVRVCSSMDISTLKGQRVADEMKKALLLSSTPSLFFENLRQMGQLGFWYPEMEKLIDLPQDPKYHPEGDVWTHTMQVLDRAAKIRHQSKDPLLFMLLALTHDFGKVSTTLCKDGRIHSIGHETEGIPSIMKFLERLGYDKRTTKYISQMVPLHMRPGMVVHDHSSLRATNMMFDAAADPIDLILFYSVDRGQNPAANHNNVAISQKPSADSGCGIIGQEPSTEFGAGQEVTADYENVAISQNPSTDSGCGIIGQEPSTEFGAGQEVTADHENVAISQNPSTDSGCGIIGQEPNTEFGAGQEVTVDHENVAAGHKPSTDSGCGVIGQNPNTEFGAGQEVCGGVEQGVAGSGVNAECGCEEAFLWERYKAYLETMSRPMVTGDDLIKAGFSPSAEFSRRLALARKLHMSGVDREVVLKQVTNKEI